MARTFMVAGVAVEALAGFFPWLRTGQRARNGFELVDAARTLDVLDSGIQRGLALAWFLVPLAAALCWLALLLHLHRIGALLAIGSGLLGTAIALSVEQVPLPSRFGVHLALLGALVAVGGGILELMEGGRHELAPEPG